MSRRAARGLAAGCALLALAVVVARANAGPRLSLVSLVDTTAQPGILAKADDWSDPRTPAERQPLSPALGAPLRPGGSAALPLTAHTWDSVPRATAGVRLPAGEPLDGAARLIGESEVPELRLASTGSPRMENGVAIFELAAPAPLPHRIAALQGPVTWTLRWRERAIALGTTHRTVLVTAGPPRGGASWPLSGKGADAPAADHNTVTAFRLRAAVRLAEGAASPNEAAMRAWSFVKRRYDLAADPDVNPWSLLGDENGGQCMTTAAFVEGVFDMLGFDGGRVFYVYPSLRRPKDPAATAIPNARIPGAFTVESASYDVASQFRTVRGFAAPGPGQHDLARAERHKGSHGIERLKMRDAHGELHNYAAAFVVEENGVRSYYGGGYDRGPYHAADAFLAGACTALVWTYERGDSDDWDEPCDAPGSLLSWQTGAMLRR
jgi:hypothetical protein